MEWKPIESAPMDGTVVDLWVVDETGFAERVPDAYYVRDHEDERHIWNAVGKCWSRTERYKRDGWQARRVGYDGDPGWCDRPEHFNPHPMQNRLIFTRPTHWMPLPEPPQ